MKFRGEKEKDIEYPPGAGKKHRCWEGAQVGERSVESRYFAWSRSEAGEANKKA